MIKEDDLILVGKNWLERVKNAGITVYGDENYTGPCELEDADLIEFFNELKYSYPLLSKTAIHVKNEGERKKAQAQRERMKGALQTGATDVNIPGGPSFIMELKRRNYRLSDIDDDQIKYMIRSKRSGAFVCLCLGYDAALEALKDWVEIAFGKGAQMGLDL